MKKRISILCMAMLALSPFVAMQAAPLSPQQAMQKAASWMSARKGQATSASDLHRAPVQMHLTAAPTGSNLVYAFNATGGGYVIVAGDDRIDDVLAYSLTGTIDSNRMPPAMQDMLTSYAEQISYMQQNGLTPHKAPTHPAVQPLIQTKWGQDWPYNHLTPNNCPTGCMATSMSQVMYYHKWPQDSTARFITPKEKAIVQPTIFDWDNMQLTYSADGSYPESQVTAVAHLMQVVGASVDMVYAKSQSGSFSRLIKPALIGCFGYDKGIHFVLRDDYTIDQWDNMMYEELANNRPIIYNAMTSWGSGHSFVCHGYDGDGKYYINWGWDGDNDGYFVLSILDSEGTGTGGGGLNNRWSVLQDAVIGIQRPTEGTTVQNPGYVQVAQYLLLSEPEITRDADGNYPLMHLNTVYYAMTDAFGFWPELLNEEGEVIYQPKQMDFKHINTIDDNYKCLNCKMSIPGNLADGTYRWVSYYALDNTSGKLLPCAGNDNIYIEMVVNNGHISLKPRPVKDLELTNPQHTLDEGKIARITFDVKNVGDEFNGNLFVVSNSFLKATECVAIPAGETQQVEFRLKSDKQFDNTTPYRIYTDPMLMHKVYGEGKELEAHFEDYDVSLTNIDMENKVVVSRIITGKISAVNVGDAPFNNFMGVRIVNPDNEDEYITDFMTSRYLSAPIGGTATMNVMAFLPANVKRIRIKLGYNNMLSNTVYTTLGDFDVVDGAVAIKTDGKALTLPSGTKVTMPEGYDTFYSIGSKIEEVVPNSNPNAVYYVDDPQSVRGLDNNIVLDIEGNSYKDINVYDGHNFYLLNQKLFVTDDHYINYYRTFTNDDVNTWAPLWMSYDEFEGLTDLTTGKDWTYRLFPYTIAGLLTPNTVIMKTECSDASRIPTHWNNMGLYYFIYPSMVGHTFKFKLNKSWTEQAPWIENNLFDWIKVAGRFWQQELDNVYEQQGNKFVRKEHAVIPAFRSYLAATAILENSTVHTFYDFEPEYIMTLPTEPDPDPSSTSIIDIASKQENADPAWYTIDGLRLLSEPTAPGLYIHNGKKIVK